jgi:hypothetical protein
VFGMTGTLVVDGGRIYSSALVLSSAPDPRRGLDLAQVRHRTEEYAAKADIHHMHTLRFHRRRLRHIVWVSLAAWLFALTAGVVNACMLTPQDSVGHGVSGAPPHQSAAHAEDAGGTGVAGHGDHGGPVSNPGPQPDAGKDGCLKFCDDESSALSKSAATTLDPGVPLLAAIEAWSPIVSTVSLGTRLPLGRPGAQGPPLVIRFLRLIL